jgi:hypothetical protein
MPKTQVMRELKGKGPTTLDVEWNLYDITNPGRARRVIYDGIENDRPIDIDPGQTRQGVRLAVETVRKLVKADPADLLIVEADVGMGATP